MMRIRLWLAGAVTILFTLGILVRGQSDLQPERWWRGNLHTHTLWSDGDDFPDMVADWYRNHGYHFLALSDHNTLSVGDRWMPVAAINRRAGVDAFAKYQKRFGDAWVETRGSDPREVRLKTFDEFRTRVEEPDRFLMIQSEELTGASGDGHALHLNVTNLAEQLTMQIGGTVADTIVRNLQMVEESAKRTGRLSLMHVNHPNYQWGVTAEDLAAAVNERFFEVWNGVDNDNDNGDAIRPGNEAIWDIANTLRIVRYNAAPLFGLATDDSHDHHGNKSRALPGRAWVMVRARHLTPESIVRALRAGQFYSSTGVTLESVTFENKRLAIRIQPSGNETFVTRFIGTRKGVKLNGRPRGDGIATLDYGDAKIGEVLAEAKGLHPQYTLRGDELYVRAVVTSSGTTEVPSEEFAKKRAWIQPVR